LMGSDFTSAMVVFSELTDVNVEQCVEDAIKFSKITPPSLLDRLRTATGTFAGSPSSGNNRFSFHNAKTSILIPISVIDLYVISNRSLIIDTRSIDVFMRGHLPGSVLLSKAHFKSLEELSPSLRASLSALSYTVIVSDDEKIEFGMFLLSSDQKYVVLFDHLELDAYAELAKSEVCCCKPQFHGNAYQSKCTTL